MEIHRDNKYQPHINIFLVSESFEMIYSVFVSRVKLYFKKTEPMAIHEMDFR